MTKIVFLFVFFVALNGRLTSYLKLANETKVIERTGPQDQPKNQKFFKSGLVNFFSDDQGHQSNPRGH